MTLKLSKRLTSLALFCSNYKKIADIGCDHGLLSLFLAENYKAIVTASDVLEPAISRLKNRVKEMSLQDKVTVLVSDGLTHLTDDFEAVVISGMGARKMIELFDKEQDKFLKIKTYILSPHQDTALLRTYMHQKGYYLLDEVMIYEDKKYYPILKFQKGKASCRKIELKYGPIFLKKREAVFISYLKALKEKKEQVLKELKPYSKRYLDIKKEIKEITRIL